MVLQMCSNWVRKLALKGDTQQVVGLAFLLCALGELAQLVG